MRLRAFFSITAFLAGTSISIMAYANSFEMPAEDVSKISAVPVLTERPTHTPTADVEVTEVHNGTVGVADQQETEYESMAKICDWSDDDAYLLARLAMAEAEDQDTEGKALVMLVALNRAWSDEFPDSIEDVIFQPKQFSPIDNGRWDEVEPNQDCWTALSMIEHGWDKSCGALYFESESASRWHRDNLRFLFKHGDHMFYTDREE